MSEKRSSKERLSAVVLIENASCASQERRLLFDGDLYEPVYDNVYKPLSDEIERLRAALARATELVGKAAAKAPLSRDMLIEYGTAYHELRAIIKGAADETDEGHPEQVDDPRLPENGEGSHA